ncbi:hypothetical protein, partial [Streptomyces fildesensis]|uniref:hypothetical protein n=1 Tax=Streptomyces fildesensis TaxID=375757 RepID=UPI001E6435BC
WRRTKRESRRRTSNCPLQENSKVEIEPPERDRFQNYMDREKVQNIAIPSIDVPNVDGSKKGDGFSDFINRMKPVLRNASTMKASPN